VSLHRPVSVREVMHFWERNPLCASAIPHPPGSPEYFAFYDHLREINEPLPFSRALHEYRDFRGKMVLDVGCGNGYVLGKYAAEGAIVTGVDLTARAVDLSRARFRGRALPGEFAVADAERLPFRDASFDCACSMGVLHHTPDTVRAIGEIRRVLRRGGRLIIMLYHRHSALYQVNFRLASLLGKGTREQLVDRVDGAGNPKGDVYSKKEVRALLKDFSRVEVFAGLLQPWMVLPRGGRFIPGGMLKPFAKAWGWFLYAKAYA
jgi:SAM-dependent methyltransferase